MSKDTFLRGALILTVAGIIVKVIGSAQRILLSRLLGGEGIGLYQMGYPIYLLALSISSAGIPIAISIIVAEKLAQRDYRGANRVFKISLSVLIVTGVLFSFILYYGAEWLISNQFVRDPRAYLSIVALAPAIFFVTVLSSYRGYFQGWQMMTPTAVSQIFEQLIRVITMIAFAYMLLPQGLDRAAAGASFGAAPGAALGLVVLVYYYWKDSPRLKHLVASQPAIKQEPSSSIIKRIIRLALPVSLANMMVPIVSNIDLFIVPHRLEAAGYSVEKATELFGYLTGMAVPLVNMATILTTSLAASLVPVVSEAFTLGETGRIKSRAATAMRIANLITIPSFVGLWLLARPISQMLYHTTEADVSIAIMSLGVFLLGLHQITTGVLQGLGKTAIPVVNMIISAGVKVALSWVLTARPEWGIKGAAWASNADFGVAAMLNMIFIYRYVGFGFDIKSTAKIAISSAVMGVTVLFVYDTLRTGLISNTVATLLAIICGGIVYGLGILFVGAVNVQDIEGLPRVGKKLTYVLKKIGLVRK